MCLSRVIYDVIGNEISSHVSLINLFFFYVYLSKANNEKESVVGSFCAGTCEAT